MAELNLIKIWIMDNHEEKGVEAQLRFSRI